MAIKPLVAGNWKMNGLSSALAEFVHMKKAYNTDLSAAVDLMICPPATLVHSLANDRDNMLVGAQDCHMEVSGAHTGDLSAEMLVDSGASAIIVGHSERRADHGETNDTVHAKALAAKRAGAVAIICVGETKDEREAGNAISVVLSQLQGSTPADATAADVVIAYEPVWAIGTGLVPTADDIAEMHAAIRKALNERFNAQGDAMRILYGGSVKPSNAGELMNIDNVNGALVGGASLKSADFLGIAEVYRGN
ncbi:MAG: triose-phosphate isomerase [Hyphomicrobiales bacterium]